ncbi:MAG: IclR family transcriptional regulator [Pseudomonadota bacterium]
MKKTTFALVPADKKSKSSVPAAEKAFDILELAAESPQGLTMNEIVDALGRTMGEIYRVVVYLAERGYLHHDAVTNRYSLTLKLFELSHRYDPTDRLIRLALPILERIAARTQQSCHLGVLSRTNVLVLASVHSPLPAGYSVRTGALFPVKQTSSGHVILAFSPDDVQIRSVNRFAKGEREKLRKRFAQIRADGFEDTPSKMIHGVRNLCVPVFDMRGVVAAITCGFIGQQDMTVTAEEALTIIRISALELSRELGFRLDSSSFGDVLSK